MIRLNGPDKKSALRAACSMLALSLATGYGCGSNAGARVAIAPSGPPAAVKTPMMVAAQDARTKDAERESAARGRASKQ